jgi:hypothetical protein
MRRPAGCLQARMWCRNMACDVSPVLRHTFSVTAIEKGISLPVLQRLLGHDWLTTTEISVNLSPEEVLRELRERWLRGLRHSRSGIGRLATSGRVPIPPLGSSPVVHRCQSSTRGGPHNILD